VQCVYITIVAADDDSDGTQWTLLTHLLIIEHTFPKRARKNPQP